MKLDYRNAENRNPGEERAEKLLMECPMCGGRPEIWYHPTSYDPDRPFVRCPRCGLRSSDSYYTVSHSYYWAFAQLIVRWNTRKYLPFEEWKAWKELGERFDESWKIPHYSSEFFDEVFNEMEELMVQC